MQQRTIITDIKKFQKNRQFLAIFILFFVSILFWVLISIVSSQTTEKISAELTLLSRPLTPTFDSEVISRIEAKKSFTQQELSSFTIYKALIGKDGRTERIVPLETTTQDLEPKIASNRSLLQTQITPNIPENTSSKSATNPRP